MSEQRSPNNDSVHLPILPLRDLVLFPGMVLPVEVGRHSSLKLLDDVVRRYPPRLLVATQKDAENDEPDAGDIYPIAVQAEVIKLIRVSADRITAVLRGIDRYQLEVFRTDPYLIARAQKAREEGADEVGTAALVKSLRDAIHKTGELAQELPKDFLSTIEQVRDPGRLADVIAANLEIPASDRIHLLLELNVRARLKAVLIQLERRIEAVKLKERLDVHVRDEMSRHQREAVLRQKMKAIQEELGGGDPEDDLAQFEERIEKAGMSEEAERAALRQLDRLREMPSSSAEYTVQRTYLEWLCDLPWSRRTEDKSDLPSARAILEADHYGIEKVKKRILEYLAVRKLVSGKRGPILCLAGPPGVGKTSMGKSIARTLGREFVRVSLGGVQDEAEIRGHRRTYLGALPGRVIQGLKRAGTKNPIMLLDEVDKLTSDSRGDPSAALLEVLDPEQNHAFSDHYLEVSFDLSEIVFICTANVLETIPPPLLDRMEVIELPSYTLTEKRVIALRHLLPKQIAEHGLSVSEISLTPEAVDEVVEHYTREAGVRNLERELASVIRAVAVKVAAGEPSVGEIGRDQVTSYLGPPRFLSDLAEHTSQPGVATGLSFTPVGGHILFIEATKMPGQGLLVMTGQMGSVMRESAQAAMSWVRAHSTQMGLPPAFFEKIDIHVHVPQGATRKDGPSAGSAILVAIVSLLSGLRVRSDVAMTGEITLRGAILPVGGIKEKVMAAHRAGIKTVVMPSRNAKDLVDVPQHVRDELTFTFVHHVDTVLSTALERPQPGGVGKDRPEDLPLMPLPTGPGGTRGDPAPVPG